jgi:hypothetical protein
MDSLIKCFTSAQRQQGHPLLALRAVSGLIVR